MDNRINNEAYNPEVVNSGSYLIIFVTIGIIGMICIICINIANIFPVDSFEQLFPFIPYSLFSILLPFPIYIRNSRLRNFTYASLKEMVSPN